MRGLSQSPAMGPEPGCALWEALEAIGGRSLQNRHAPCRISEDTSGPPSELAPHPLSPSPGPSLRHGCCRSESMAGMGPEGDPSAGLKPGASPRGSAAHRRRGGWCGAGPSFVPDMRAGPAGMRSTAGRGPARHGIRREGRYDGLLRCRAAAARPPLTFIT